MQNAHSTSIYNFSPDAVISCLSSGDWVGCWNYLRELLENLTSTSNIHLNVSLQNDFSNEDKKKYATDFGALAGELILALLTDPSSQIPDKNFMDLIRFHETLHNLFYLFGLEDTDKAVETILASGKRLSDTQQKKLLLLLSLNTDLDIVSILKRIEAKYRVPSVTTYLSYMKIVEKNIYNNKVQLYALRADVERTYTDYNIFTVALFSYFTCSYMNNPNKHSLKENVNATVQKYLATAQAEFRSIQRKPRDPLNIELTDGKPVLAVFLEAFTKGHAMNRSWGDWVNSLKSEFNVILLIPKHKCSDDMKQQQNILPFGTKEEMVKLFHDLQPDILVFPSVGMDMSGLVASNMRLAPLQIMALGHPATTMSPYIDFVYGQSCLYNEAAFPKDKYIADDSPYRFIPYLSKEEILAIDIPTRKPQDTSPLKVSIVGSNLKISYPFIQLLQEIEAESAFEIHFSFHLGSVGMDSLYLQKFLSRTFKKITFYGYQSYSQYFDSIKTADIVLNPFPFGHTNTIIDTLLLGKPCIGMDGGEPASKTERCVLDMVGLSDQFIAKDIEDYKQKFYDFSSQIMEGKTTFYNRKDIYDHLYGEEKSSDFGKVLKWIHDNQESLKKSHHKKFNVFQDIPL